MKFKLLLIIMVSIGLGVGLSFWIKPYLYRYVVQRKVAEIKETYPNLAFEHCQNTDISQIDLCLDEVFFNAARSGRSEELCQAVRDKNTSQYCLAILKQITRLDSQSLAICEGMTADSLCLDLVETLVAYQTHNYSNCKNIINLHQKKACDKLISDVNDENATDLSFGLSCGKSEYCQEIKARFKKAVLDNEGMLCNQMGEYSDFCGYEVIAYQAFITNNSQLCDSLTEKQGESRKIDCLLDFALAKVGEGEKGACQSFPEKDIKDFCVQLVDKMTEGRFAYLEQ